MELSEWLLKAICCPRGGGSLSPAQGEVLSRLDETCRAGRLRNMLGQVISAAPEAGLVSDDREWFYPMEKGVPCLLPDEAISLKEVMEDTNGR